MMTTSTGRISRCKGLFKASAIGSICYVMVSACSSPSSNMRSSAHPAVVQVLSTAEALLGTPYCSAGATPECFDCSGFVSYSYAQAGIDLPRIAEEIFKYGQPVMSGLYVPGDLVFFRTIGKSISHVGIMIDALSFIHSSSSRGVMVSALTDQYWAVRFVGAKRVANDN